MKKLKQLISVLLVVLTVFSLSAPAFAADSDDEIQPRVVVARINIPAANCREAYNDMCKSSSWSSPVLASVSAALSPAVGVAYAAGEWLLQFNYNSTKKAFKKGADSGKGCTMLVYDTALPCVIAN
jgi:hypothetical protein